ncbi:class I adenylate-forming enzyme family protein [Trujillonella endophytica]|uniref:Acyl-CoA synthetase (AMP-forming)/AMP-acid ligase II n=1 Tax=Trujillonella endophytica TaxID=673521 RepID=A0A1H8T2X5_9ACTN|nr:class I adenylate-forming enzyme family protein [Trujillella endophytica]SEO85145.1 Acyl-CoA synthetase (AMP-forming)/AMP-acid ligase II [Trujillella endophytica]
MVEATQTPPARLHWEGAAALPPAAREALLGPGAPFELGVEDVLGRPHTVFVRRPRTLRALLEDKTPAQLDLPFLVSVPTGRTWTYRDAMADMDAIALLLQQRYGVRPGDRIAIVAANHAEYALLMWAVVTIGAVVTGLNGWWTGPELRFGIALSSPVLVVGDARRLERIESSSVPAGVPVVRLDELHADAQQFLGRSPEPVDIAEDDPAVLLFTSGTTGRPKGAVLTHRNIVNFALVGRLSGAMAMATAPPPPAGWTPPQACSVVTGPLFHVSGIAPVLVTAAASPTKLVFPTPGRWDPVVLMELVQAHRATYLAGVPTQFWRLLRHPDVARYDLSTVTSTSTGGSAFPPELVRALHERFPRVRLGNGYGMTETVGLGARIGNDEFLDVPESVGPAQATVEIEVRRDDGSVAVEHEVGEVFLRSPSVFLGYWGDEAATAAALHENRWYRTGDFGRISGGLLFLESRRRDLIIRGGENVYPIEIENRLIEHPDVDDAAVIGVDHPDLGQEPKAFVVPRAGSGLTEAAVRAWCGQALAAFKVPATVEFRTALPYSDTGKLLKVRLEEEQAGR